MRSPSTSQLREMNDFLESRVSRWFKWKEFFIYSPFRLRKLGLDLNSIIRSLDSNVLNNIRLLANQLDMVRTELGVPIIITSGYRPETYDLALAREYNFQRTKSGLHSQGKAADVTVTQLGKGLHTYPYKYSLQVCDIISACSWIKLGYIIEYVDSNGRLILRCVHVELDDNRRERIGILKNGKWSYSYIKPK